jgi:hypothetical protein
VAKSTTRSRALRAATVGAAGIVVAGLMVAPGHAVTTRHGPVHYAKVSRASRVPAGARRVGPTSRAKQLTGAVALKPRNPGALHAAALEVSNPRSPRFHHYLPRGAFAATYGPSTATVHDVEAALRSAHLAVTSVSSNRMFVHFRGSVGDAEAAFRTRLANYRMHGRVGRATTAPVSLPDSIAPQVASVIGLDTLLTPTSSVERGSKKGTPEPTTGDIAHHAGTRSPTRTALTGSTRAAISGPVRPSGSTSSSRSPGLI